MSYKWNLFWVMFFFLLFSVVYCRAEDYTNDEIANAIYKAEGSEKASKPFGILSVECNGYDECRQICLNTIKNQRIRHAKHNCGKDFFVCFRNRYAPLEVHPLNKNWLKNVRWFLQNETI